MRAYLLGPVKDLEVGRHHLHTARDRREAFLRGDDMSELRGSNQGFTRERRGRVP